MMNATGGIDMEWSPATNSTPTVNIHQDTTDNQFIETRVTEWFYRYYLGCINVIGIIGNILTFTVMIRPRMRGVTTCSYMAVIALCDLSTISMSTFWWSLHFTSHKENSGWECRIYLTVFYFSIHYSVTLLVAMTAEKFVAVWFPLKATYLCTVRNARIIIGCTLVIILGINLNHLFTRPDVFITSNNSTTCMSRERARQSETLSPHLKNYHLYIWPWLDATLYSFIPLISLVILNILILIKLKEAEKLQSMLSQVRKGHHISTTNRQITVMLLLVTSAFIVLTMPVAVMLIAEKYWEPQTPHEAEVREMVSTITACLMYTNHAVNFILQNAGAARFRNELCTLFCCYKKNQESTSWSVSK